DLLCLRHFMPELPKPQGATHPVTDVAGISSACALDLTINATGSLDDLAVHLIGEGQDLNLDLKAQLAPRAGFPLKQGQLDLALDRKSTRLNSSHVKISYAVFCLKKKNKE